MCEVKENFREFVLRRSKEILGYGVVVHERKCKEEKKGYLRENFLPEKPVFYELTVFPVEEEFQKTTMQLLEGNGGSCVLVCDHVGYLKVSTIEKLMRLGKCKLGIRSNRIGLFPGTKIKADEWTRVHDFRTEDKESAEMFLLDLKAYVDGNEEEENCLEPEIDSLSAKVWKSVNEVFNTTFEMVFKTEYYPSLNPSKSYYYDLFRIYLDEDFFVEVRKYPDHEEFFCETPGRFWRCNYRKNIKGGTTPLSNHYADQMKKLEDVFAEKMHKLDRDCLLISSTGPYYTDVQVAEFRSSDSKVIHAFLETLYENRKESFYNNLINDTTGIPLKDRRTNYKYYF